MTRRPVERLMLAHRSVEPRICYERKNSLTDDADVRINLTTMNVQIGEMTDIYVMTLPALPSADKPQTCIPRAILAAV